MQVHFGRGLVRCHVEVAGSIEVALGYRQDVTVETAFVADQGATLAPAGIEAVPPPRHQQPENPRPQAAVEVEEVSVVPESKLTGHRRD
jgi:hypothetical protein